MSLLLQKNFCIIYFIYLKYRESLKIEEEEEVIIDEEELKKNSHLGK